MKTAGVTDYINQTPPKYFGWIKCPSTKIQKYLSNVHKLEGVHLRCINNHYAKFEYEGMKAVGEKDYIKLTLSALYGKNVQVQDPPPHTHTQKNKKKKQHEMYTK